MEKEIEFVKVIYELLPGFVAAWVFYGLTTRSRREISGSLICTSPLTFPPLKTS